MNRTEALLFVIHSIIWGYLGLRTLQVAPWNE